MPMDLQLNVSAFNAPLRLASLPTHHPMYPQMVRCRARAPRYFKSPIHKVFITFPELMDMETVDARPHGRQLSWSTLRGPETTAYSDGQVGAAAVATAADGIERAYLGMLAITSSKPGSLASS
ncbi:hypothetical protein EXIGLDRAFT_782988 [Exidia glandulosa HHB12029]|uniref:Uncharacterized protein n=1 Tax=Exidia glandulosa HHB12029 TaxID=1314781 RepID=A0A166NBE9_EXIGL|nr:hypothetical protein EXIGLDRAFT_782988 [Exidia glandulosa HHB12029]